MALALCASGAGMIYRSIQPVAGDRSFEADHDHPEGYLFLKNFIITVVQA